MAILVERSNAALAWLEAGRSDDDGTRPAGDPPAEKGALRASDVMVEYDRAHGAPVSLPAPHPP
jgi:hypothetical protein